MAGALTLLLKILLFITSAHFSTNSIDEVIFLFSNLVILLNSSLIFPLVSWSIVKSILFVFQFFSHSSCSLDLLKLFEIAILIVLFLSLSLLLFNLSIFSLVKTLLAGIKRAFPK